MKRVLAILLVLCALFSVMPMALAADAVPFADVEPNAWYADEVRWVYEKGLMDGVGGNMFSPEETVSRCMVWVVLARMDGADAEVCEPWYEAGRNWAMENGISDGTGADESITREQLVTMLWRYAGYLGVDVSAGGDGVMLSYADAVDVSEWAVPAMQLACETGILQGVTKDMLAPQGTATRAQLAAMLRRCCEQDLFPAPETTLTPVPIPTPEPPFEGIFDAETLFIGDSLTCGLVSSYLQPNGYMGEAGSMATANMRVTYFFKSWWTLRASDQNVWSVAANPEYRGMTFENAVRSSAGRYDTVYFHLGTNGSTSVTAEDYYPVLDLLLECYPKATVYVQTLADNRNGLVATDRVNGILAGVVETYHADGEERIVLLDTNAIWDADCMRSDGVHFNNEGYSRWYALLCENELASCRQSRQ